VSPESSFAGPERRAPHPDCPFVREEWEGRLQLSDTILETGLQVVNDKLDAMRVDHQSILTHLTRINGRVNAVEIEQGKLKERVEERTGHLRSYTRWLVGVFLATLTTLGVFVAERLWGK
jgi:hypothetical protein